MRRYTVAIDGHAFTIDVAETASDAFEVTVDGRRFAATLTGDRDLPGVAISPEVGGVAPPTTAAAASVPPSAGMAVDGPRPAAHPVPARPSPRASSGILSAPMPGAVLEVHVAAGDVVRRGDAILVLEAMKMRNTIRAPRDGTVLEVAVEAGSQVASGEPLARFGPPPG